MKCICKPCTEDLFTGTCDGMKWKCMPCERAWALRDEAEKKRASLEDILKKKLVSEGVSEDWLDSHLEVL